METYSKLQSQQILKIKDKS